MILIQLNCEDSFQLNFVQGNVFEFIVCIHFIQASLCQMGINMLFSLKGLSAERLDKVV